jgi:hypothetical protein
MNWPLCLFNALRLLGSCLQMHPGSFNVVAEFLEATGLLTCRVYDLCGPLEVQYAGLSSLWAIYAN